MGNSTETLNSPPMEIVSATRIQSVDILRGAVMILMAIDHVRVYSGLPAGAPEPGIFFTRWITHFCAPAFVFLAGTSAFLYGNKIGSKAKLARFLVTRGLLLVVMEVTLIRFFWTFNFAYSQFTLAGVIWMLGWCMVLLALFIRLRPAVVGIIGLAIIFFQQLFSLMSIVLPQGLTSDVWEFIYPSGSAGIHGITILYVLVPWIGVMAAGYGFGAILLMQPDRKRKICLRIGLSAIALFIMAGSAVIFLKPASENAPPFIFRLLNQQKYPASPLFLLMTLGPLIAFVPLAERARGKISEMIATIGRVPMFYYLLHILLIHITALVVMYFREGSIYPEWYAWAPYSRVPEEHRWGLPLLYLVFIVDVVLLFFACKWYVKYKFSHPENKMLKYL